MIARNGTVGIVGLGIMGSAIARNLIAKGTAVRGYDIDPSRVALLRADGGEACNSAAEAAQGAALLLTSLPSVAALDATVESLLSAARRDLVVAELSTLPIAAKEQARDRLAAAAVAMLDCPLSGTGAQAATGDLAVYASGARAAYDAAEPAFLRFARASHYLGAFGNGSKMKFVANLLVAIHNVASAEAMVLGMKAGLDPATIVEVIASGAGNSRVFELRAPLMAAAAYRPATMKIEIWQKDMTIIGDFARELGVATPTFAASAPVYDAALKAGLGGDDTAAVCAILETRAGLTPNARKGGERS
ncbi:MAG TPA: NAD(P)-dependent oxidoreductase [Stellaceae bacterium]|nr:NAD(P)-dependent oxidoreductase [Stellaceae bacterium]